MDIRAINVYCGYTIVYAIALFLLGAIIYLEMTNSSQPSFSDVSVFFPLFFLLMSLMFFIQFRENKEITNHTITSKAKIILSDKTFIIFNTLLAIIFALILQKANFTLLDTFFIVLICIAVFICLFCLLDKMILSYLFWINLYLFMLSNIMPPLVLLNRYNPLGSLIPFLFQ